MFALLNTLPVIDRVFDDVMRTTFQGLQTPELYDGGLDVRTEDDKIALDIDVPGVKAEDVTVEVEGNLLRIRGQRRARGGESNKRFGTFARTYKLPEGYDTEAMTAELKDGVLTVEVPRHPKAMARKVPILTAGDEPKQLGTTEQATSE